VIIKDDFFKEKTIINLFEVLKNVHYVKNAKTSHLRLNPSVNDLCGRNKKQQAHSFKPVSHDDVYLCRVFEK